MRKSLKKAALMMSILIGAASMNAGFYGSVKAAVEPGPVNVWMTTADQSKLLHQEGDIVWNSGGAANETTINVNENSQYQQMDGFGAAMTDSSAWLMANKMNVEQRSSLMNKLFDHQQGIGISYLRLPMGATDFSLSNYTYDDMPAGQTDPELQNFSIQYDKAYIIPMLRQAREINPDLKIMGSPWSAPAWMKTTGSLIKGKLKADAYQPYANYFTKFVQAYAAEGIPIDAVTPQNEPHFEPGGYPGMRMDAEDQAAFIKSNLGPAFEKAGIGTKIIAWDHNWDEPDYPIQVLSDPEANKYTAGSAFHGYAGEVGNQQKVHDAFPDKGIYFTEVSGGEWAVDFGANLKWDLQNLIIGATRNWAKNVLKWNLALDPSHGPTNGGCADCRGIVTIDQATGNVSYNVEYYSYGHASKFVKSGAYRIASNTFGSGGIEDVAFRNPDGSKVLIALNSAAESRNFQVRWGDRSFQYTLPAGAVATFVWSGQQTGETFISPYSVIQAEDFSSMSAVETENASDAGYGKNIKSAADNSYILFKNVEFTGRTATVNARIASGASGGIEFRTGSPTGTLLGSMDISSTGGPQAWRTKTAEINGAGGVQDLYLVFRGSVNVNWLQFSKNFFADSLNYVSDNGDFEQGDITGWSGWNPDGQASAQKVDTDGPRSGRSKLTHWLGTAYQQTTYRTVHVPNGTYKASVWIRKDTGNQVRLEVKKYGGPDLAAEAGTEGFGSWKQLTVGNVKVTNGQVEIGVFSDSPAGKWAAFDDFELSPVTTEALDSASGAGVPLTPTEVQTVLDGGGTTLKWQVSAAVDGYVVYRSMVTSGNPGPFTERTLLPASSAAYMDKGLQEAAKYCYRIAAFNETGESAASAAVCPEQAAGKDTEAPPTPEGLRAKPGVEKMTLYWSPSLEKDFLKYNIYQDGLKVGSADPVTQTAYTIEGLTRNKGYRFSLSAVDRAGNESPLTAAVLAAPIPAGMPVPIVNSGFETGTLDGWMEWHPGGQAVAAHVDNDFPKEGGTYKLTYYLGSAYQQTVYREVAVKNGTYRLTAWARAGGGQKIFRLEAGGFGGSDLYADMRSAEGGKWTPFTIEGIQVTNGKLKIGVYSDANAGNWAAIDDFQLVTYQPVDMYGPIITFKQPVDGTYGDAESVKIDVGLSDDLSGVDPALTRITLDGHNMSQGETIDLYKLNLGKHTLQADSVDLAGNTSTASVTFTTETSIESLQKLVARFTASGEIDNAGIADSLQIKLTKGQQGLQPFQSEVSAQKGKHITSEAAGYLLRDAAVLADNSGLTK